MDFFRANAATVMMRTNSCLIHSSDHRGTRRRTNRPCHECTLKQQPVRSKFVDVWSRNGSFAVASEVRGHVLRDQPDNIRPRSLSACSRGSRVDVGCLERKRADEGEESERATHGCVFSTSCKNHSRSFWVDGRSSRNIAVEWAPRPDFAQVTFVFITSMSGRNFASALSVWNTAFP